MAPVFPTEGLFHSRHASTSFSLRNCKHSFSDGRATAEILENAEVRRVLRAVEDAAIVEHERVPLQVFL